MTEDSKLKVSKLSLLIPNCHTQTHTHIYMYV